MGPEFIDHYFEIEAKPAKEIPQAAASLLLKALQENHEWHKRYDETDSYPGSELCLMNEAAIKAALGEGE